MFFQIPESILGHISDGLYVLSFSFLLQNDTESLVRRITPNNNYSETFKVIQYMVETMKLPQVLIRMGTKQNLSRVCVLETEYLISAN